MATSLNIRVTAAVTGAVAQLAIYEDRDGIPNTLLADGGTSSTPLDCSTIGVKTATISLDLEPGLYWLACLITGGAPSVTTLNGHPGGMPYNADPSIDITCYRATTQAALQNPANITGGISTAGIAMTLGVS
jgi:hypothetical protein